MKRVTAQVKGRVQGVSFRYNSQLLARKMGLSGWIRNEPDGSVYVLAEGPRPVLEEFIEYLSRGPRSAKVESLITNWSDASGEFNSFEIRWI